MIDKENTYFALDGVAIGKRLEKLILQEDPISLRQFSQNLTQLIIAIRDYIILCGGEVYLSGGDNILALLPISAVDKVIDETDKMRVSLKVEFAIGIGTSLTEAYLALKYAKTLGGNPVVKYNDRSLTVLRTCVP